MLKVKIFKEKRIIGILSLRYLLSQMIVDFGSVSQNSELNELKKSSLCLKKNI